MMTRKELKKLAAEIRGRVILFTRDDPSLFWDYGQETGGIVEDLRREKDLFPESGGDGVYVYVGPTGAQRGFVMEEEDLPRLLSGETINYKGYVKDIRLT